MTAEQWVVVGRVYEAALELSQGERASFVKSACGGNEALRLEVESLLAAQDQAGEFLQANAADDLLGNGLTNSSPLLGKSLHQYELLSLLGAGGMGEVYYAMDTRLRRYAAVKVLPASYATDEDRLRRFEIEAKAASGLNHPNIVTIYETGETENGRFIAMEFVQGETLRHTVHLRPSIISVTRMCLQVAEALKVAHAAQIVHRDIKPENLILRPDGYIKVLDFGLARLLTPIGADEAKSGSKPRAGTQPGMLVGTALYMSPEQARGMDVTAASDIFSMGVVMYELGTGQHPFRAGTQFGTLDAILSQTPLRPSRINPGITAAWEELNLRMLDKEPAVRPSAITVQETLAEIAARDYSHSDEGWPRKWKSTVGRVREQQRLKAAWDSAAVAHGTLCCVAGEPGIGKTTLVEEFLSEVAAKRNSPLIARGRCSERLAGTEAYSPLVEALGELYHCSEAMAALLRQRAPTWSREVVSQASSDTLPGRPAVERAYSQERFKRELAAFLQELSRQQPVIFFLEDLHWADLSTFDLLAFLTDRISSLRVLVIVTYRTSDLLLSPHPFLRVKQDFQAKGMAEEIKLDFLSRDEIGRFVDLEFPDNQFPPQVADMIHAKTEGNPLFMADLLRYLRDRQVVAQVGDIWKLARPLPEIEKDLPPSIEAMIDRMIGQLTPDDRRLLLAASVQGHQFDSAVISRALDTAEEEVENRLQALARVHGFVSLVEEHEYPTNVLSLRYRFTHVLYQNALYDTLQPARRATLSNAVAEALQELHGEHGVAIASVLARLFDVGRRFMHAAENYLLAARNAGRMFAANEAAALARKGLSMVGSIPKTPERDQLEFALQLELGNALLVVLGYGAPEVEELYGRAHVLWREVGKSAQLLPILYGLWVSNLIHGRLQRALAFGEDFLDLSERVRPEAVLVGQRMVGCPHFFLGRLTQALAYLQQSATLYDPVQHRSFAWLYGQEPGLTAHSYLGWTLWMLGYPEQAAQHTHRSLEIAREVEHPLSRCHSLFFAAVHAHFVRDWGKLREWTDELVVYSRERKAAFWIDAAKILSGLLATKNGDRHVGTESMRSVIQSLAATDTALNVPILHRFTAEAYAESGKFDLALSSLEAALFLSEQTQQHFYQPELYRFRGELLLRQEGEGAMAAAEKSFGQALDLARQQSARSWELQAAVSLSRLWVGRGRRSEAVALLSPICEWFTEGRDTANLIEAYAVLGKLGQICGPVNGGDVDKCGP